MKKRILMIYPKSPTTYWSFKYALPFIKKRASFPPLGLLTVAGLIPKDKYDIKLVDMNTMRLKEKHILESDIVFVSAMIVQKSSFNEVIELCNKLDKPIVAGGPYPTSSYKEIKGVNHFVLNEGEITIPKFLEDYEKGTAQYIYQDDKKPDITRTPIPRFDLIKTKYYSDMMLQYSRGCPFNCEFCDIIEMFGRVPRTKEPLQFIKEIQAVYDTGFRGAIFIVDDNFIGNKVNVKKLLPEIAEWQKAHKYPYTFFTEASINLADDEELMDLMVSAGFDMVFLGIETPNEECLTSINKHQNVKVDMLESITKIQKKGIEVSGGFIIGFDQDPHNIFDLMIDFIQKSKIPMAMVGLLTALPNTQLYRRLSKEGRLLKESHGNNTHNLDLNFIPKMEIDKLIEGYQKVLKEVYKPKKYFQRCYELLKTLPPKKVSYRPIRFNEIRALILSLVNQTFSTYSIHYTKFLLKVLIFRPKHFSEAVRMAIMGQHFFKITRKTLAINTE